MNSKLLHIFIEKEFHSVSLFDRFTESEKNILATAHFFVFFLADGTPTVYIINKKKSIIIPCIRLAYFHLHANKILHSVIVGILRCNKRASRCDGEPTGSTTYCNSP